ncbi:biliverdin-producing heme oxygenase [Tateyamaria armeniaca]|uniref:Biliverdin-producing heme oxygenase n=1 Tax=Tateyamaria armeniaca TaxID=2518930 RepID=A0ABW8UWU3_9RHOB
MSDTDNIDVRRHLQRVTRDVHDALHRAPVLRQLTAPGLSVSSYNAALSVFTAFYHAVERKRVLCGAHAGFSVQAECDALSIDLNDPPVACPDLEIDSDLECLGALYVAHGASFGRNTFRANVARALPDHPHAFVRLAMDKGRWAELLATLDAAGQSEANRRQIEAGATRAFSCMWDVARTSDAGNAVTPKKAALEVPQMGMNGAQWGVSALPSLNVTGAAHKS